MLRVEAVSKAWRRGTFAVRDLTLDARPGVLGLLGPNGAGKTTLMQMVATLTRPSTGRVLFDGVDVARDPEAVRRRLGYLPQDFGVYDNLTALEFLDYVARLKGIRGRERLLSMLEKVFVGVSLALRYAALNAKGQPPALDYGGWWGRATLASASGWLAAAVLAGGVAAIAHRARSRRDA